MRTEEITIDTLGREYQELTRQTADQGPDETTAQRLAALEQQIVTRMRDQAGPLLGGLRASHKNHTEAINDLGLALARALGQAQRITEYLAGRRPEEAEAAVPPALNFDLAILNEQMRGEFIASLEERRRVPGFVGLQRIVVSEEKAIERLEKIMTGEPSALIKSLLESLALADLPGAGATSGPGGELARMLRRESQAAQTATCPIVAPTSSTVH